jgi:sulfoxide reductase heme-binding subunit YedZ
MLKGIKVLVFCVCLIPFLYLLIQLLLNNLGPDPGETLSKELGEWTLRFLIATLAITPIRQTLGFKAVNRYRRMIGLFVLFYASIHFFVYQLFILNFRWASLFQEIIERPYITVGFSAYVILVILGVTSPKSMVRKLGKNWKRLHRLVYLAAILGIIHMVWILRSDFGEALLYGSIVAALLGYRVVYRIKAKMGRTSFSS